MALAQRETTREALSRMEETLDQKLESGGGVAKELVPVIVVSVNPAFEESKAWYPTAALATLGRIFGTAGLRSCEACMAPRLYVESGRVEQNSTALDAGEITRLDDALRGKSAPARVAVWLDETAEGVSLRMVDLRNSHLVFADNFDPALSGPANTRKRVALAQELDRRARGDSLVHTFLDATFYPGQHLSLDWSEQWGATNANLSGVTLSLFDPVLGIGVNYYRVIPQAFNITVGAKIIMSLPTALVSAISQQSVRLIDPLLTGVLVVRVPISTTNYAVTLTASTNGHIGVGFSLMNFSLLPFLP